VLFDVPPGTVLSPLLFIIIINDINKAVECMEIMKKIADDTKVGQSMITTEDEVKLQEALDGLPGHRVGHGVKHTQMQDPPLGSLQS
jgi:hypothetical protein